MMRSLPVLLSRPLLLLACALLAGCAVAQIGTDGGTWEILEARYGSAQRSVDVTQRMREVTRFGANFRVDNDLFGTDPHPGMVKTLRIHARNRAGLTRTFDYPENQVAQGAMFASAEGSAGPAGGGGPRPADDGDAGQWQILQARYGTAQRNVDVTQRLRELARTDTSFRVGNDLFGTDPHPGVVKTLRIYARNRAGLTRTFEYPENQVAHGTMFTGWREGAWGQGGWAGGWGSPGSADAADAGQWQILQARYGTAQRNVDVTQRLRDLARTDTRFRVGNDTLGVDPHPGVVKTLRIYARQAPGTVRTFEYGEDQMVDGALFTAWAGGRWGQGGWDGGWGHYPGGGVAYGGVGIVSAQYGEGRDRIDVTARLRSLVRNGRISARVTNDTMGSDPAPGRAKVLWVTYYVGGQGQRQTRVYEGQDLVLP